MFFEKRNIQDIKNIFLSTHLLNFLTRHIFINTVQILFSLAHTHTFRKSCNASKGGKVQNRQALVLIVTADVIRPVCPCIML